MRLELGKEVAVVNAIKGCTKAFNCEDVHTEIILEICKNLSDCFCMVECEGLERN